MIRTAATILLAGIMGLSMGACNDTLASSGADAAVGVYTLRTIDGQSLPVIVNQQGNDIAEITQGTVTLDSDGSFADITELSLTQSGVVSTETDAAVGAWALSGRTVQFVPNDGSGGYEMTWDGQDQLTQSFNGSMLVYQRQP